MKTAVCLYGLYNNHFSNSGDLGYQHIKERVLSNTNDVDFFCHSWSVGDKDSILEKYNPKKYLIEKQIDFTNNVNSIDLGYFLTTSNKDYKYLFRAFSFYYTRAKALEMKKKFEEDNRFKYDCVLSCRYDVGHRDRNWSGKYFVSRLNFNPYNDMRYVYSAMWDQLNAGMADHWFYSSSDNMDKFILMFDKLSVYLTKGSEYEINVTNGWFDSNFFDAYNVEDKRQFTNEVLKQEGKSKNLMRYPVCECLNNHIMHKWFLKDVGLYENCKYLVG
jgi:hypothetical protein